MAYDCDIGFIREALVDKKTIYHILISKKWCVQAKIIYKWSRINCHN